MSDIPADLGLGEQIARIDRDLAESAKLREEIRTFTTEQHKLDAEAREPDRARWLAPALAIASVVGGLLGVASFIARLLHP